jgi:CHAD domain-containing protein
MLLSVQSKGEIGRLLAAGGHPAAYKAEPPTVHAESSIAKAFAQLVHASLRHWLVNQAATLDGDAEGMHQMRIAIRRLATQFNLFRPYIAPADYAAVDRQLTRFGRVFGGARDWDVFTGETLASAARKRRTRRAARKVARLARPARRSAHHAAEAVIREPRYTRFLLRVNLRLAEQRWLAEIEGDDLVAITAASGDLLDRQARKAQKAGKGIARLSPEDRHMLRKRLKKLRYSAEFLAGLYEPEAVRVYVKRIKNVLDLLGKVNDLAVAETLLAEAVGSTGKRPKLVEPLRRHWGRQCAKRLDRLPRAWRRFTTTKPFWEAGPIDRSKAA